MKYISKETNQNLLLQYKSILSYKQSCLIRAIRAFRGEKNLCLCICSLKFSVNNSLASFIFEQYGLRVYKKSYVVLWPLTPTKHYKCVN